MSIELQDPPYYVFVSSNAQQYVDTLTEWFEAYHCPLMQVGDTGWYSLPEHRFIEHVPTSSTSAVNAKRVEELVNRRLKLEGSVYHVHVRKDEHTNGLLFRLTNIYKLGKNRTGLLKL